MKLTVIGAGYVGLVTAACLADTGNEVMCIEKVSSKLETLRKGESPIYEPGLSEVLKKNISNGNITFSDNIDEGVRFAEAIFLCVGTPQSDTGKADLSQVEEAARQIASISDGYKLIIEKSTVPVNTHRRVKMTLNRYAAPDAQFDVASNPEFLREGSALYDFSNPDRIVVGVESERAEQIFKDIYKPYTDQGFPLLITTPAAAELIKHASNSFLALKISYINMVSDLCEKVGADIELVADGMGYDKRIGRPFLNAGLGYGGSCFPKDIKAFINMANENGVDFTLLEEADMINASRRSKYLEMIEDILWINKDKQICIWGLAFKPNTDDIREAPAIDIVGELGEAGAQLRLFDPKATENFKNFYPEGGNIKYFNDKYEALNGADALLIVTEWSEFKEADIEKIKSLMQLPIIIDGRNIYDPATMKEAGVEYYSIGR
ncbi:UDP-glucose dehydrogenase family protein [Limisalsivibrio acetivorans]|uniref:UDP-glucose dehydrogenase family protein n=1 Tax=Limisalsivibrio acetivorans TaxID=1304888 RepID=UPI0003B5D6D5|nr:UDP-glucose/GDP-mannose dehydrogenase family protein [Limisalsivibrio acetivorans]